MKPILVHIKCIGFFDQVKLVVPNCTVGMIIGKGGCYIKQINEETGGHVQISQKSQDTQMLERVVNISG